MLLCNVLKCIAVHFALWSLPRCGPAQVEAVLSKLSLDHDADSPLLIEVQQRGEDGKIIEQDALKSNFNFLS